MAKMKHVWFFLAASLVPLVFSDAYLLSILVTFAIFAILAQGLNLVVGYLGELSFGHAAFFGIGAYVSAILSKDAGLPIWLTLIAAMIIAGIIGAVVAILSLRLKGAYFAIVTLAIGEILRLIALNWVDVTKGPMGYTGIHPFKLFGFAFTSEISYYYLVLFFLAAVMYYVHRFIYSKTGRAVIAIREQSNLAQSIGINVFRTKIVTFAISTMIAGLAGVLYAHFFRIVTPDQLGLYYTTSALIMVMVGGRGTLWGPIVGACIFTTLPETLRMAGELRLIIFALLLGVSSIFMPDGITTTVKRIVSRYKALWMGTSKSVNSEGTR